MTDQPAHTNPYGMEHVLLSVITVWSKEFAVGGACSDDTIIHSYQASANFDIQGHGNRNITPGSLKSCSEMQNIISGWNINDGIPPRNIRSFKFFDKGT